MELKLSAAMPMKAKMLKMQSSRRPISNARRQARLQKQLGVALFRDNLFDTLLRYALVWILLLAVVAGFAESYASHDKYYPYNLDTPRKLL
ncbi:MAG: hypothetical protein P4L10_13450 [Acidobacteriaceae bacterium]|jgi:hypothetical protein|nr:hypothetical protein [Acidobacteriaceae bacterium]